MGMRMGLVWDEDGDCGDDYNFVAFPGENGHTLKKINCRQHAMVSLLSCCVTHTHTGSLSTVWFLLYRQRGCVDGSDLGICCWRMLPLVLEVACMPSHMTFMIAWRKDVGSMWDRLHLGKRH